MREESVNLGSIPRVDSFPIVGILASGPSCHRLDSQHSQIFLEIKFVHLAEINQWRCLEESGQWLENVDGTHLVLASGKLELQKILLQFPQHPPWTSGF